MSLRKSEATWKGKLKDGIGNINLGSGGVDYNYSFGSRFEDGEGTNPEELIAAAHAGCFSMAFAHALEEAGHEAEYVHTVASVELAEAEGGFSIPNVKLQTEGRVPEIGVDDFQRIAEDARENCPVSKLLKGAEISLEAKLIS